MKYTLILLSLIHLTINLSYGQFSTPNDIINNISTPLNSKAFDLDNDGFSDVITASPGNNSIIWYKNLGNGDFSSHKIVNNQTETIQDIDIADLNNDGYLDVLASSLDHDITWYENLGNGSFSQMQQITNQLNQAGYVYTADLDNDGDLDVISSSWQDNKITWYENLNGGKFGSEQSISSTSNSARFISISDLDNDGNIDILSAQRNDNSIAWHKNLGGGSFAPSQLILFSTNSNFAATYAQDIDNDGDTDLISVRRNPNMVAWHENLGGGAINPNPQLITNSSISPLSVNIIDMDNDNDLDILSNSLDSNKLIWFENLGNGNIDTNSLIINSDYQDFPDVELFNTNYPIDYDNDGDVDILTQHSQHNNHISIYENLGSTTFSNEKRISKESIFIYISKAYDLNGDGNKDIISLTRNRELIWQENLGNEIFSSPLLITDTLSQYFPNDFKIKDIDNDGDLDIMVSHYSPTSISTLNTTRLTWYENDGSGNFLNSYNTTMLVNSALINIHNLIDLDNDGDIDALLDIDKDIYTCENLGNGIFSNNPIRITAPAGVYTNTLVTDVDSDGDMDVIISGNAFFTSSSHTFWKEYLGPGIYAAPQNIFNYKYKSATLADIDNDGHEDFIMNRSNSFVIEYIKNTNGSYSIHQNITCSFHPDFLRSLDVDADGDIDIIASSSQTNGKISWFENINGTIDSIEHVIKYNNGMQHLFPFDADGDGDLDILSNSNTQILWFENFINTPFSLKGNFFYDSNQNMTLDSSEHGLSFLQAKLLSSSASSHTDNNGNFVIVTDSGSYTLEYTPIPQWNLTTDSSTYTRTLTSVNPIIDSLNFGFYPDTIITAITPNLIGGFPRCNQITNYWIDIRNEGTTLPNGIIHLQLDSALSYISSAIVPDSIVGQNIYWSYDSLFFFSSKVIQLQVLMPSFTGIGNTMTSILNVLELDPANNITYSNTTSLKQELRCAYDPNDKMVTPKGLGVPGYILANQELEYLIRFQNTGNDTAFTVVIRDQLDSNLDWTSLQPIASSHNMQINIEQDGEAVFRFDNILLPDSNVNEIASHGFVKFKINMQPNIPAETRIFNTGHIYFDFNPPIITNTVVNTIYDCTNTPFNLLSNTTICSNEHLKALTPLRDYNNYLWEIDSLYSDTSNAFNWTPDTAGTFNFKLTISNSLCSKDSNVSITVIPSPPIQNNNQAICQGDSLLIYGTFQKSAGIYYDSLQTILGCDSILSTTLSVNPIFLTNQTQTICQGDSLLVYGTFQKSAGIYYDSLQTISGCDSIFSTTLSVNSLPNVTISDFSPDTVCSDDNAISLPLGNPSGGTYSGAGINGNDFEPSVAGMGNHPIIYSYTDTNSCINNDTTIINVQLCNGINKITNDFGILIYPNPSTGQFTIEKPNDLNKQVNIKLLDASSKLILKEVIPPNKKSVYIDISSFSNGLYYLQLIIEDEMFVEKILKK